MEIKKRWAWLGCGLIGLGQLPRLQRPLASKSSCSKVDQKYIDKRLCRHRRNRLARFARKRGRSKRPPQAVRARLRGTTNQERTSPIATIVIEAVIENLEEKEKNVCRPRTAIVKKRGKFVASNTSVHLDYRAPHLNPASAGAFHRPTLLQSCAADETGWKSRTHYRHGRARFYDTAYEFGILNVKSLARFPVRTSDKGPVSS